MIPVCNHAFNNPHSHACISYLHGPLLFILYMNDLPDAICWIARALLFVDDTKCFKHIKSPILMSSPFKMMDNLVLYPIYLSIPLRIAIHVSFNQNISTSYNIMQRQLYINATHIVTGVLEL